MTNIAVENRSEARLQAPAHTAASFRVLEYPRTSAPIPAEIANLSGRGLRLRVANAVVAGTLIRVDWEQTMLLGEVCYSEPEGDAFALGIRLEHSLTHTESLARLRKRFADDEAGWEARRPGLS